MELIRYFFIHMVIAISVIFSLPEMSLASRSDGTHSPTQERQKPQYSKQDLECLALNIYHEARGESVEGMVAVGQIVLNRKENAQFPNTICGVVKHDRSGGKKGKCQFSWWCDGKSDDPTNKTSWNISESVAEALLEGGKIPSLLSDVNYYVKCGVKTVWLRTMSYYGRVGDHCFYIDDDGEWEAANNTPSVNRDLFAIAYRENDEITETELLHVPPKSSRWETSIERILSQQTTELYKMTQRPEFVVDNNEAFQWEWIEQTEPNSNIQFAEQVIKSLVMLVGILPFA